MAKINVEPVKHERFSIDVEEAGSGAKLVFSGDVDIADPSGILDPFFASVHSEAHNLQIDEVTVDFSELNFLNSSGIKAIAKWVMKLGSSADTYKIVIVHDKAKTWQTTSLPTLTYLVPGAVSIK